MRIVAVLLALLVFDTPSFAQIPKKETPSKEFDALFTKKDLEELKALEADLKTLKEQRDRALSQPQVIFYSPVLNPSGDRMGYVKRTLEYRLTGGGAELLSWVGGGAQPGVEWISDTVEVCERDIASGRETVTSRWQLPKPDNVDSVGGVVARLEWRRKLLYEVNLTSYNKRIVIPGGRWCYGSGFCLSNTDTILNGVTRVKGVTVGLDLDPERQRYPVSNNIVLN